MKTQETRDLCYLCQKDQEQQETCDFSDFVHDTQAEWSYREATTENLQVLCQSAR